jgi:Flp pilus assembly protein TadD
LRGASAGHELTIALYQYLVAHDPFNYIHHSNLAYAYWYAGRIDDALNEHRLILALDPAVPGVHGSIAEALLMNGDATAALYRGRPGNRRAASTGGAGR